MKHTRAVSAECSSGFACHACSNITLVCFIVNEHTTKCSRYSDVVYELPLGTELVQHARAYARMVMDHVDSYVRGGQLSNELIW